MTPLHTTVGRGVFICAHNRERLVMFSNLTPEFFDLLIVVVIIIGIALAVVRLYRDFTRFVPPEYLTPSEETQDHDRH